MAFTLWNLFEATILCLNAACILNDQRFLSKIDWNFDTGAFASSDQNRTVKHQLLKLIVSIKTVAKVPLIFFNIFVIIVKLILG